MYSTRPELSTRVLRVPEFQPSAPLQTQRKAHGAATHTSTICLQRSFEKSFTSTRAGMYKHTHTHTHATRPHRHAYLRSTYVYLHMYRESERERERGRERGRGRGRERDSRVCMNVCANWYSVHVCLSIYIYVY